RARARLRARLTRQGVTLSAAVLTVALGRNAARAVVPSGLLGETCRAAAASRAGGPAAAVIPTRVTVLSEGVLRTMLMDTRRKLLGVLLAAGVVAAGAGALAYRAPAGEPPGKTEPALAVPGKVQPVVTPPAAPAPADEPATASVYRTANFRVEAPSLRVARLAGVYAEHHRKAQAVRWLGRELPPWLKPCPLRVKVTASGSGGATAFSFDNGKVLSRDMHVEGPLEQLLSSVLPHEVTHAVIADHFRAPVPRWADEGIAVLAEDDYELQRHDKMLGQILKTPGRAIPLRRLFSMKDYPRDVMVLWAEGYSVAHFLVGLKDRKTFLAFVKQGTKDGWDKAAEAHYGFRDVEALEDAWLKEQRKKARAEKETAAAPRPKVAEGPRPTEKEPASVGPMPVTTLAVMTEGGRVRVQMPFPAYQARTSYVLEGGGKVARPVTTYAVVTQRHWQEFDPTKVEAYQANAGAVAGKKLAQLLAKETPVLVSADGQKVDPFHMQVIKRGTLVLVVPQPTPPPAAEPPSLPFAPAAPVRE
ncbi:MAG TPA: hypothetical protein VFE78_14290, partial [Gemmataceae bacterium]|nr:hypothetical protein [Gemmataceae bacterium]